MALGEANGCKLIADDTKGENLSQSVMIVRSSVLDDEAQANAVTALQGVWDKAVGMVNANPEMYRTVLVEHANLPEEIADTYPISTYPTAALPTNAMVDPVLAWMKQKGYLDKPLTYDGATGEFRLG